MPSARHCCNTSLPLAGNVIKVEQEKKAVITLILNLTEEEETRLKTAAEQEGLVPQEYLLRLVRQLPAESDKRILRGYGMLTHIGRTVEEFHQERQEDRARENREFEEAGA